MVKKICKNCSSNIVRDYQDHRYITTFCSRKCVAIFNGKNSRKDISGYRRCLYCNKEFSYRNTLLVRDKNGVGHISKKFCSIKCSLTFRNKTDKQKASVPRGENCWHWKGGISLNNFSHTSNFRKWREKVFERDNWTCNNCKQRGGKLNAHHIKEVLSFPELKEDINNGITLCFKCHKKTDNWGIKSVWRNRKNIAGGHVGK